MWVHFMGDPAGDKNDYARIIEVIQTQDHLLVTDHILHRTEEEVRQESPEESQTYVRNSRLWMRKADVVVFEASKPSISLGFEVADAFRFYKKAVIVLYQEPQPLLNSLKGIRSNRLRIVRYEDTTLEETLAYELTGIAEKASDRFQLLIPPRIRDYLDWRENGTEIPRAEYIRALIAEDMEGDDEYWGLWK